MINNGFGRDKAKASYSAPKLTLHGDVSQLTAAGTGNAAENTAPGGPGDTCMVIIRKPAGTCV